MRFIGKTLFYDNFNIPIEKYHFLDLNSNTIKIYEEHIKRNYKLLNLNDALIFKIDLNNNLKNYHYYKIDNNYILNKFVNYYDYLTNKSYYENCRNLNFLIKIKFSIDFSIFMVLDFLLKKLCHPAAAAAFPIRMREVKNSETIKKNRQDI